MYFLGSNYLKKQRKKKHKTVIFKNSLAEQLKEKIATTGTIANDLELKFYLQQPKYGSNVYFQLCSDIKE